MESFVANGAEKKGTRSFRRDVCLIAARTCRQIYGVTTSPPLPFHYSRARMLDTAVTPTSPVPRGGGRSEDNADDVGQRHVALTSERERETNEMGNGKGGAFAIGPSPPFSSPFLPPPRARTFSAPLFFFQPPSGGRADRIHYSVSASFRSCGTSLARSGALALSTMKPPPPPPTIILLCGVGAAEMNHAGGQSGKWMVTDADGRTRTNLCC